MQGLSNYHDKVYIIKSVRNGESQTNHDKDVPNFTLEHYYLHREKNNPLSHYNAINCDFF